jgi:hypothetical protein
MPIITTFTHFERPKGENQRAQERGDAAPQFEGKFGLIAASPSVSPLDAPGAPAVHPLAIPTPAAQAPPTTTLDGKVQVEVVVPHAPPGTRVNTQSSGQVNVAPPSIGMPMSGVTGDYHRGY